MRCVLGENIFPFCRLWFCPVDGVLCVTKLFCFMRFHLLIVVLGACAIGALFRKLSPVPVWSRLFPTSSSVRFNASGFMLRSLIHLDLNFVQE